MSGSQEATTPERAKWTCSGFSAACPETLRLGTDTAPASDSAPKRSQRIRRASTPQSKRALCRESMNRGGPQR
jgi:hypothetical protein